MDVNIDRGGVVLTNDQGGFYAYLTIEGTDEWRELSWQPDRSPQFHSNTVTATQKELTAYIRRKFVGWVVRKNNVPDVDLEHRAKVPEPNELKTR